MSNDKAPSTSSNAKEISSDASNISSAVKSEKHGPKEMEGYHISKNNIPSFKKILVTDDGKDISNKAFNYAVSLSNSTGAELITLRILEHVEKFDDVTVEGYNENSQMDHQNFHRNIKGEVIDAMEAKVKKCEEAGCKNKISYK